MKISLSTPGVASLLLLGCLTGDVLARPKPDPADMLRRTRGRKGLMRSLEGRGHPKDPPACADTPAKKIKAPKHNLWHGLSGDETAAVVQWLFHQPELNLTTTEDAGEWDNTMYVTSYMYELVTC